MLTPSWMQQILTADPVTNFKGGTRVVARYTDFAPIVYALPAHTLPAGHWLIFKPDGTVSYIAAGTDVNDTSYWHSNSSPSRMFGCIIRCQGFISGTVDVRYIYKDFGWTSFAGDPSTFPTPFTTMLALNPIIVLGINAHSTVGAYSTGFLVRANTNWIAATPATCAAEFTIFEADRL